MSGSEPGWYDDGVTAGVHRWFDGSAWTPHTRPSGPVAAGPAAAGHAFAGQAAGLYPAAGQAAAYPQPGYAAYPQAPGYPQTPGYPQYAGYPPPQPAGGILNAGPSEAAHWLLPVGRSWQAVVAPYVGLVSVVVWILSPVAIWFGVWAFRKASTGGHGRGRATFAIVTGGIGLTLLVVVPLAYRG